MAKKNNLKPKPYAKTIIDRWEHLTGHELKEFSQEYYTSDQIRAIAAKYKVKNYSKYSIPDLVDEIKTTDGFIQAGKPLRKTLFELIKEETRGESHTAMWYRDALRKLSSQIKREKSRMTIEERMDSVQNLVNQDENQLRRTVFPGHMYFFKYEAISRLPYYDRFPLVYVLRKSTNHFYGANFHYLNYKQRAIIVKKLENGIIDFPYHIIHKYLISECKDLFLDLATYEWETAVMLPVEDFVMTRNNKVAMYDKDLVWEETRNRTSKKLKASAKKIK